jgi:tight adherence protein B
VRSRRHRAAAVLLLAAVAAAVLGAPSAGAQDDGAGVAPEILSVDATNGDVGYAVLRSADVPRTALVNVNGSVASIDDLRPLSAAADRPTVTSQNVVFVLDNADTGRSDRLAELDRMKAVVRDVILDLPRGARVGLVTTGGGATLRFVNRTDLPAALEALDRIRPAGRSALWDGVKLGASNLAGRGDVAVASLVVLADTPELDSLVADSVARAEVVGGGLETHVVAVSDGGPPVSSLRALASVSSGSYREVASHDDVAAVARPVAASVGSTYLLTFSSPDLQANGDLVVRLDDATLAATYVPGGVTRGPALLAPVEVTPRAEGAFSGTSGLVLAVSLSVLAAVLLAYAGLMLAYRPRSDLATMLDVYTRAGGEVTPEVRTALLQRAVAATASMAERRGLLARTEARLEGADMPVRAAEALTIQLGIMIGSAVIALFLTRNPLMGLVFAAIAAVLPPMLVDLKAARRRKRFEAQLPDMLTLMASTLKAGYSFMQGVEAVSHEVDGPMGQELRRVVTESQLGRPLEEALEASAERMGSLDFAWAVMAVRIQREVGGNLAELLMTVADTMVARNRLRGEVKALTAEGQMSAIVLGLLPLGLGGVMFVINPDYMGLLLTETIGRIMLAVGGVAMIIGFLWMKKMITIEI